METFNCRICGAINFSSQANLTNHQRSTKCRPPLKRKSKYSNFFEASVVDGNPRFPDEPSFDEDEFLQSTRPTEAPPYDSTYALMHWIRHCRNGMGLSQTDITNLFQDVIFHKSFKLHEVTVSYTVYQV